ncbi:MAG: ATP-binding protein [Thermoplasmata archaeon]|nr:MAG: ATP-binding protein [Thermoplasmata archaeon]
MVDPRLSVIKKRLKDINNIIAVASGKGGVGKSMVSSLLALHLASQDKKVGLLDLDVYGPSTHIILGIPFQKFPEEDRGIIPPVFHGIKFMSIVFYSEDKPGAFRGIDVSNIIRELLAITQWGSLDYLIIDLPPGIGDETLDVINLIQPTEFLIVSTPSKVAMGAVEKLIDLLLELHLPIIGVVENMKIGDSNYVKQIVTSKDVRYLGSIQFVPALEEAIGDSSKLLKTPFIKDLERIIKKSL